MPSTTTTTTLNANASATSRLLYQQKDTSASVSETISSSTADLHRELISASTTTTLKRNSISATDKTTENNKSEPENSASSKHLTTFSQIVYQSRVKHFVNAVECNGNSNTNSTASDVSDPGASTKLIAPVTFNFQSSKLIKKLNSGVTPTAATINASPVSNSYRLNSSKPKPSIAAQFVQRSNEAEYSNERRLLH